MKEINNFSLRAYPTLPELLALSSPARNIPTPPRPSTLQPNYDNVAALAVSFFIRTRTSFILLVSPAPSLLS